jgi:hypothetical protein
VYTPVLFDFTTEDRYWIEIPCLLLIDKARAKDKPIHDCRCDERLKPKDDESTCLARKRIRRKRIR